MKRRFLSLIAVIMILAMCFSLVACGGSSTTTADKSSSSIASTSANATTAAPTEKPKTPVTLKMFGKPGNKAFASGIQTDPVAQEILKETGITIDWEGNPTEEKQMALLASGELPDIMQVDKKNHLQVINGNNAIDMSALVESNGPDIKSRYQPNVDFSKKYLSNNTGKLYFLPSGLTTTDPSNAMTSWGGTGLYLRWDYYKEIGFPKIANNDDIVSTVRKMLDKHPTNEKGLKNYGFSLWFDFGGMWTEGLINGDYSGIAANSTIQIPVDTLVPAPRYSDPTSAFWKEVELYYKMNKAGILDPESFTQKYDNATAKATAGRVLAAPVGWQFLYSPGPNPDMAKTGEAKGWIQIPMEGQTKVNMATAGKYPGTANLYFISTSCKTPDRAMDLLNYLFSDKGVRTLHSGVEGIHWDMVNGVPTYKPETIKGIKTDAAYNDAQGIQKYSNYAGAWTDAKGADGFMLCLVNSPEFLETNNTALDKDFIAHYDPTLKYPREYFEKTLKYKFLDTGFGALMTDYNDDMKLKNGQIESYLNTQVAKCALSKSDAEYQKNVADAVAKVKAMGVGELEKFKTDEFNKAKATLGY